MHLHIGAIAFVILINLTCSKHNNSEIGNKRSRNETPTALSVDLNGDGVADCVTIVKNSARNVTLTAEIKLPNGIKKESLNFFVDRGKQDGFCGWPVELIAEPLDYEPDPAVGPLQGYVKSNRTIGVRISDGRCDDFHIYWNQDRQGIDWWRQ
jgi:hypothetical protein